MISPDKKFRQSAVSRNNATLESKGSYRGIGVSKGSIGAHSQNVIVERTSNPNNLKVGPSSFWNERKQSKSSNSGLGYTFQ